MVENKCENCNGDCCKHVAIEIDEPEDLEDFENIKWYVCHKNIWVYKDTEGDWLVEFITPCEFLDENNKCTIYERRSKVCRDYSTEECTMGNNEDDYVEIAFKTIEDVEKYISENDIK